MRFKPSVRASRCPDRTGGGLVLAEPKSWRSHRTIALPAQLVTELKVPRRQQQAERLAAGVRDARHTAGTLLLEQGVALRVVMVILGQQVMPEVVQEGAEWMGGAGRWQQWWHGGADC